MARLCATNNHFGASSTSPFPVQFGFFESSKQVKQHKQCTRMTPLAAAKSDGFSLSSILQKCETCKGKGAVECRGCKGTGKNKKNGNIFERWKCFNCQGFGLISCPNCGKVGLTPEQRGER